MYMSIKKAGNPNWGGARLESKLIKYYADQWCRDNGYPLQKRYYKTVRGVQVLQYCVPLYVSDDGETLATKAAPTTLVRARKAWGPNDI